MHLPLLDSLSLIQRRPWHKSLCPYIKKDDLHVTTSLSVLIPRDTLDMSLPFCLSVHQQRPWICHYKSACPYTYEKNPYARFYKIFPVFNVRTDIVRMKNMSEIPFYYILRHKFFIFAVVAQNNSATTHYVTAM
jgi:hypothetical protein